MCQYLLRPLPLCVTGPQEPLRLLRLRGGTDQSGPEDLTYQPPREMAAEKNERENEIILDKIRKLSMCGDQDRITNSNLLDAMATIAEQIALVARMGDEDEVRAAASDTDDDDMIDDRSGSLDSIELICSLS